MRRPARPLGPPSHPDHFFFFANLGRSSYNNCQRCNKELVVNFFNRFGGEGRRKEEYALTQAAKYPLTESIAQDDRGNHRKPCYETPEVMAAKLARSQGVHALHPLETRVSTYHKDGFTMSDAVFCAGPDSNARRTGATATLTQPNTYRGRDRRFVVHSSIQSDRVRIVDPRVLSSWPFFLCPCPQAIHRLSSAVTTVGHAPSNK